MRWLRSARARRLTRPRQRRERDRSCAASRRPCADPLLSAYAFKPDRPAVSVLANLFGLCGRGDRAPRPLGRLLDGVGAGVPLPPLGRLRLRSHARSAPPERLMGATLALWTLALGRVSLASAASRLYGLAPSLIQPKRSHRWPSRVVPPQLRLASKAAASSLSRRAITTRSAPTCLPARPERSKRPAPPTTSSAWPAPWRFQPAWRSLSMPRKGRAPRLDRPARAAVWSAGKPFTLRLSRASQRGRSWTCRLSDVLRSAMASSPQKRSSRPRSEPTLNAATKAATRRGPRSGLP